VIVEGFIRLSKWVAEKIIKIQEWWNPPKVPERWYALNPTLNPYPQYTFTELPLHRTLYSEITFEERLERLGLGIEQYREILNSFVGGSLHLKKKDPGAPYNKYPIVKTKFLDGYEPK